jgi:hypothetical protein
VLMFEMLLGRPPFVAPSRERLFVQVSKRTPETLNSKCAGRSEYRIAQAINRSETL